MAILWPKIGQRHFGARASHGHNLAIFHQILTNEHTKMTSSLRRIEWNQILSSISLFYILVFWLHFCSEASHGQCCTYGLKTTLKLLVHVLAIMASSYLKIVFLQKSGLNPPPLKWSSKCPIAIICKTTIRRCLTDPVTFCFKTSCVTIDPTSILQISQERNLRTARRLQLCEQTWNKLAGHFALVLADFDSKAVSCHILKSVN